MMVATQGQSKPSMVASIAIDLAARRLIGTGFSPVSAPKAKSQQCLGRANSSVNRNTPGVRLQVRQASSPHISVLWRPILLIIWPPADSSSRTISPLGYALFVLTPGDQSITQSEPPGVVESRSGAVATYKPLRFHSPLIKPGVRISLRFGMQRFLQLPDGAAGWQIADDMRGSLCSIVSRFTAAVFP